MQSSMIYAQYIKNNAYCLTFISFNFSKVEITQFFSRNKTMIVWKHRLNKFTPRDYNKHEMLQTFYFFGTKNNWPALKIPHVWFTSDTEYRNPYPSGWESDLLVCIESYYRIWNHKQIK